MNPPTTMPSRDPAEYLASVLPLNPIFQADEILAARDRFLGRAVVVDSAVQRFELADQREELQARVAAIREHFWELEPKELREALESLDIGKFPDLMLAVERLQAAFRVRREFPEIEQHDQCYSGLLDKLREVIVAAPREAGRGKQAFFLRVSTNKRIHRHCTATIKMLRNNFPDVFDLESEWLTQIEQTKPIEGQTVSEKEADRRQGVSNGWGWTIALVLLGVVGRGVASFDRSHRNTTPPKPIPQQPNFAPPTLTNPQPAPAQTSPPIFNSQFENGLPFPPSLPSTGFPNRTTPRPGNEVDEHMQRIREHIDRANGQRLNPADPKNFNRPNLDPNRPPPFGQPQPVRPPG